jgi:hypothetical protein
MNLLISLLVSSLCYISIIVFSQTQYSMGQVAFNSPKDNDSQSPNDIFRVAITIIGVNNETGNVFSFVKVNDDTSTRYFNASKDDLKDQDGFVDSVISFPNKTVTTGANFTACNVVLKELSMSCKSGINIQERIESIQFVLPTFKPRGK